MNDAASTRRAHIVGAATSVFLRYGFGRTTMADIAKASGLSRPTLYLAFQDKESVLRAVIEAMIEAKMAQVRTGISGLPTLAEKLLYACNAWAAEGYELVQTHPDARDMFDLGFESVCAGYQAFQDVIATIVRDGAGQSALSIPPAKLARSIVYALKGFKDIAVDSADLRTLIATHVAVVSAALSKTGRTRP